MRPAYPASPRAPADAAPHPPPPGPVAGFTLSLFEYTETIVTLWDETKKWMGLHPEHVAEDNSMDFLSDDGGKEYNHVRHDQPPPPPVPALAGLTARRLSRAAVPLLVEL